MGEGRTGLVRMLEYVCLRCWCATSIFGCIPLRGGGEEVGHMLRIYEDIFIYLALVDCNLTMNMHKSNQSINLNTAACLAV